MPTILHRLSIDAPPESVHQVTATKQGIQQWWNGCSTNWAAYLMSLQSGAEGDGFNAYPGGEMSRWD